MKALSIRQPWAWLLMHGTKDIENRNWPTSVRGTIAIHAAKGITRDEWWDCVEFVRASNPKLADCIPGLQELVRGAVIGTMELRDCVHSSGSPWFRGPYGFKLDTPQPCDPIEARGALGFWDWTPPTASPVPEMHAGRDEKGNPTTPEDQE
jgi:hypothetical protein